MKILVFSDLHLEFGRDFFIPVECEADVIILAGDIVTFTNYAPLKTILANWNKPVLYVAGNHEYYKSAPIGAANKAFKLWLSINLPNVVFLDDESVEIDGVHFFGGTMWTDFNNNDPLAMLTAEQQMNDYRLIKISEDKSITPQDTINLHQQFVEKLQKWFEADLLGSRVVINHHAPIINPHTQYDDSPLMPAFNSLDMLPLIEKYQPNLWVYGHTHECDDQTIGNTRIISNQRGYPRLNSKFECKNFNSSGTFIEV